MRIALLPDEYLSDWTRVYASISHDSGRELQTLVHDIVVIAPGEPNQKQCLIEDESDSINVWRLNTGKPVVLAKLCG